MVPAKQLEHCDPATTWHTEPFDRKENNSRRQFQLLKEIQPNSLRFQNNEPKNSACSLLQAAVGVGPLSWPAADSLSFAKAVGNPFQKNGQSSRHATIGRTETKLALARCKNAYSVRVRHKPQKKAHERVRMILCGDLVSVVPDLFVLECFVGRLRTARAKAKTRRCTVMRHIAWRTNTARSVTSQFNSDNAREPKLTFCTSRPGVARFKTKTTRCDFLTISPECCFLFWR